MIVDDRRETGGKATTHPALTDAQAGLTNSRHFDMICNDVFDAGDRGIPFTITLLTIGAGADGPEAKVRAIGQCILGITRSTDLVSHTGNGRYVLLLLGTNERVRCHGPNRGSHPRYGSW